MGNTMPLRLNVVASLAFALGASALRGVVLLGSRSRRAASICLSPFYTVQSGRCKSLGDLTDSVLRSVVLRDL